jgi:hypothetical protein
MTSPSEREPDPLEAAYAAFEAGDVAVDDVLAEAKALADDGIFRLRAAAHEGSSASRERAAEKLAAHFADDAPAAVLDRVVAGALDDAGMHGEALETRRRALAIAPAWHPGIAADLCAGIAQGFVRLGNAEGAVPWIERAFSFDPFHIGALRTLVEALVVTDDVSHAFGVGDHLARFGVPTPEPLRDRARPANVPPFAPDLGRLRVLSDVAWGRLAASIAFDARPRPMRSLRVHALGCAMRGAWAYATTCAQAALSAPMDDPDELVAARGLALAAAVRATKATNLEDEPRFSLDPSARRAALRIDDRAAMRDALHDPAPAIRLFAAEHIDDPAATAILVAQAELERTRDIDLRPSHEVHGAAATIRSKSIRARRSPLVLPVEGADHPMFTRLREGEWIVAWAIHPSTIDARALETIEADLAPLRDRFGGAVQIEAKGDAVSYAHRGADAPRALHELVESILSIFERRGAKTILVGRFARGAEPTSWRPVDDVSPKQAWYERLNEDGWNAAFDTKRKPPLSDPHEGWTAQLSVGEGHVAEVRPLRMVVPDLRIVWGLPEVEHRGAPPLRTPMTLKAILARAKAASQVTPRGESMARALEKSLAAHLDGTPVEIVDHRGHPHALDEIVHDANGKARGFAFGLHGVCGAFVQHVPGAFWFREYEAMLALRNVIRSEGLAPVVHWFRRDGLWVFNLWEAR